MLQNRTGLKVRGTALAMSGLLCCYPAPMKALSRRYAVTLVMLSALFLLGAQQAAFVHLLSHLGSRAEAAAQPQEGGSHGTVPDLSCTLCAAFAALDAAPLSTSLPLVAMPLPNETPRHAALTPPTRFSGQYRARAPPILL